MGLLGSGSVSVPGGWAVALSVSVPGSTSGSIADSSCQREGEQQTQRWERAVGPPQASGGCWGCFIKKSPRKEWKLRGEMAEEAPDRGIFAGFFPFNGKLTPVFNAVMPSDLEMWANEAFCFLCII